MDLSEFAFGTASVGSRIGYPEFDRLASRAAELGLRRFDAAPQYGRGLALKYLRRWLDAHPDTELRCSTKVGRMPVPDLKSLLVVLRQREIGHAAWLSTMPRRAAQSFSPDDLALGLRYAERTVGMDAVDTVFIHSSPTPLAHQGLGEWLEGHLDQRRQPGVSDPHDEDLAWLAGRPRPWTVQCQAADLLARTALQRHDGPVWINSIVRLARDRGQAIETVMRELRDARPSQRVFVVGFNHPELLERFAAS